MGRREIFAGLFVILVILGVVFGVKKARESKVEPLNIPSQEETQALENKFNLTIPDDVEKINLQAVENFEGVGIATRKFEDGTFTHIVVADLPEPESGSYEGSLVKDDNNKVQTGALRFAKGGYLLEFSSNINYSDYKKVEIRLNDKVVLTGSF